MNKVDEVIKKLKEHHKESDRIRMQRSLDAHEIEKEMVLALFEDIHSLEVLECEVQEEHGYNGYYTSELHFTAINGVSLKDQGLTTEVDVFSANDTRAAYKSWLVEAKMTKEEMDKICTTLDEMSKYFFDSNTKIVRGQKDMQ